MQLNNLFGIKDSNNVHIDSNHVTIDHRFKFQITNFINNIDRHVFTSIGEDNKTESKVIIKVFPEQSIEQYNEELRHLDSLVGHVTHVKYAGQGKFKNKKFYFIIMPFHGNDLGVLPSIVEYSRLSIYEKLKFLIKILKPIALLLDKLKNSNTLYTDLKSNNIVIDTLNPKDFIEQYPNNIARLIDIEGLYPEGKTNMIVPHTLDYSPPELKYDKIIHPTIHTYCLAIVLYELMGNLNSPFSYIDQIRYLTRAENIKEEKYNNLYRTFQKATDTNPEKRFKSCIELLDALEVALAELE